MDEAAARGPAVFDVLEGDAQVALGDELLTMSTGGASGGGINISMSGDGMFAASSAEGSNTGSMRFQSAADAAPAPGGAVSVACDPARTSAGNGAVPGAMRQTSGKSCGGLDSGRSARILIVGSRRTTTWSATVPTTSTGHRFPIDGPPSCAR